MPLRDPLQAARRPLPARSPRRVPAAMGLPRRLLLLPLALLAASAPRGGAFYLPGLAPVNFCEEGKTTDECKLQC